MTALRWVIAAVAVVPVALTAVRLAGWWPCDVGCQGGGHYQRVGGVDVLWPALIGYLVLAGSLIHDAWRKPRWSAVSTAIAGALGGVSLFYLYVAWGLGLVCPFCLTIHATVLAVLLAVAGDAAGPAAVALLLGTLGANAVFHHQPVADMVAVGALTADPLNQTAAAQRAEANRTLGSATAPVVIDYALSLQCSHCAAQHQPLLEALAPALAAGRVRVVIRPVVRPADPASAWLAQCALAAAARSASDFESFLREHLGTRADLSRADLLMLGGDLALLDGESSEVAALSRADQQVLAKLGFKGSTPFITVRHDNHIER